MNLDVDKQTLDDLAIFENGHSRQSVFNLFNRTKTIGGQEKLTTMFGRPLTDADLIKERISVLQYLRVTDIKFEADKNTCDFIEFYLRKPYHDQGFSLLTGFLSKIIYRVNNNSEYYIIQQGIESTLKMLDMLLVFVNSLAPGLPTKLEEFRSVITGIFESNDFAWLMPLLKKEKLNAIETAKADHLFRRSAHFSITELLTIVYELDVYQSVSLSGKTLGFGLPSITKGEGNKLVINGLFHPFVQQPVGNDIVFDSEKNVSFITGTNMAGKSTLLKAIGIAIYLSQLGFPVPAAYMETSVFNGLITTINLSDNIDDGQSHFYKEVLRVKQVAEKINSLNNVFVIFDELFRGTNVKDAYDASLAIISAFAKVRSCFFLVSTHIVEVAHHLAKITSIGFRYMETVYEADTPKNSYLLKNGITEERLGMWIVNNEKIIETIENSVNKK
jgi:DNA mismatch repair protein MutS